MLAVFVLAAFSGCSKKETDDLNSVISDVGSDLGMDDTSSKAGSDGRSDNATSMKNSRYSVGENTYM